MSNIGALDVVLELLDALLELVERDKLVLCANENLSDTRLMYTTNKDTHRRRG